ncbi:hypothetical protein [Pasteurella sp. PK-2025]|uniref:hypothetical protein n=1 Tax=Pasteurella sp. PK-2025 TaxID=3413133 RepID=UPI003C72290F
MKKQKYNQAPLPFIGQKRMFLKHFTNILNEQIKGDGEGWTIIDAFGGSGLLSHTAKQLKPKARVIYNDFDDYTKRLENIDDINKLRRLIIAALAEVEPQKKLQDDVKKRVIEIINRFDGFIDVHILTSWLLFSGKQCGTIEEFYRKSFYNCVRKSDYQRADGYLEGVEVVKESFHTLLPRFYHEEKTIFVLDPPYLCTKQESYRQETYFDLIDFLRLVSLARPPFIFFSSTKSEFIRFINYLIEHKKDNYLSFEDYKRIAVKTSMNGMGGGYEDNLIYKLGELR